MANQILQLPDPSEKQKLFLLDRHKYVAFGGARGGGKSWAVRIKAILLCLRYPGIKVMIIRKSYPELRANHIDPMKLMLPDAIAKYNDSVKEHQFRNKSKILYRYCDSERDMSRYQGTEADIICIDEATQFDENVFKMFAACCRGVNDFPKRIYLTCNPGGKGHAWVKRLFVDKRYQDNENPEDYSFIQSLVTDNKALLASDSSYIRQLQALPPRLRDAWLYGKWDIFEGQFFEEFTINPNPERRFTHVIEAFQPPKRWKRFRSFDFGYSKPFSMAWWAVDEDDRLYRILEMYGCTDQPNEGVKWPIDKIFQEARRIELEHPYLKGCSIEGVADPAIWEASHGPSIADSAAAAGIYFSPGDHKRIPGWMQVHYRMAFDEDGIPMMYVFDNCKAFIRTMPMLTYSDIKPEDLDTSQEDHVADEVRYMCMLNPIGPRETITIHPPAEDPLDLWKDAHDQQDEYTFFRI